MGLRVLLVVYDNDSHTHFFPMGLGVIAAILEREGHECVVWNQDMHHWPDSELTVYLDKHHFDAVAISVIAGYYQYAKLLKLSQAINRSRNRPTFILGGYGPTPEPGFFLKKTGADIVALGEGEVTAVHLFRALEAKTPLVNVPGIAYYEGSNLVNNPRPSQVEDLDSLPWAAYHIFPMEYYRLARTRKSTPTDFVMPMMSGRGCTFRCTFCYRMDTGYRSRDPEALLDEVEYLHKTYRISYVSFMDDLLMTSVDHTERICAAFERRLRRGLQVKWNCNGRLNYCTEDLLKRMRETGCVFINYGIESVDNTVLKLMKKGLRYEHIKRGIEMTLEAGISPGLNFMFGNLGDTRDTLRRATEFLLKYDDFAQMRTIRPVTPYPGSPLYYMAIERGLLDGPEDFYENKHLNSDLLSVNFTDMTDDEVHEALAEANLRLIDNYQTVAAERARRQVEDLYVNKNTEFRGFREQGGAPRALVT